MKGKLQLSRKAGENFWEHIKTHEFWDLDMKVKISSLKFSHFRKWTVSGNNEDLTEGFIIVGWSSLIYLLHNFFCKNKWHKINIFQRLFNLSNFSKCVLQHLWLIFTQIFYIMIFPQHLTNGVGQIYFKDCPTFEKLFLKSKMLEISVSTGDLKTGHKKSIQEIIGKTLRSKHYSWIR